MNTRRTTILAVIVMLTIGGIYSGIDRVCAAPTTVTIADAEYRNPNNADTFLAYDGAGYQVNPESYGATIGILGKTATFDAILVDLSSTQYPHAGLGTRADLLGVQISASVGSGGVWLVRIGHVERANATNGDVQWGAAYYLGAGETNVSLDFENSFWGAITSSEVTQYVSDDEDANATWLQTDAANVADAVGNATASAGAGDIVVEFAEISGTATSSAYVRARYTAR
jgi:hypothetical protein